MMYLVNIKHEPNIYSPRALSSVQRDSVTSTDDHFFTASASAASIATNPAFKKLFHLVKYALSATC